MFLKPSLKTAAAGNVFNSKFLKMDVMLEPKFKIYFIFIFLAVFVVFGFGWVESVKAGSLPEFPENFDWTGTCPECTGGALPSGWDGGYQWVTGQIASGVYRSSPSAVYGTYNDATNLSTRPLTLSAANTYTLTFWYRGYSYTNGYYMNVYVSTSPTSGGTQIISAFAMNSTSWRSKTASNFTVTSSGTYYIRFAKTSFGGDGYAVIDDVTLTETVPADTTPPTVGQTSPTSATVNVATTFSASVSDNVSVTSCSLYVDGVSQGTMSGPPCASCTASRAHTFTTTGTHTMYARCSDAAGNATSGTSVNVNVNPAISIPTVTTGTATIDATTQLPSNQATLNGTITATGGQNADFRGFEWGTTSGGPYSSGCQDSGSGCEGTSGNYQYLAGVFTYNFSLPAIGTTYYYRAKAHNSTGWGRGVEKRVVVYRADGGQRDFNTCQCSGYTAGGCCDGCYFCPVGKVSNGAPGQCVTPNSSYYCNSSEDCDDGDCSAIKRWYGCSGTSTSCSTTSYQQETVYAQAGYTLTATCGTTGTTLCGYSGYNGCAGVGSPYSCQKKRDQLRCAADSTCSHDVGDDVTNVAAGYVCSGGTEMAASTTYYCGFSAYNSRSADKCDKKKDYLACNANVCNYGDYGDVYDPVTAYKIANTSGQEVDASSGDNAGTCHSCTEGSCSGFLRWGECNGAGDPASCSYYQEETVYAQNGYTLTSACVTNGTTYCITNQCRDGGGWHHLCSKRCDAAHACNYWVDATCVDHCVLPNNVQDCDETGINCGGSCVPCASETTPPAVSVIAFDDGNQVDPTASWRNISLRAEVSCTDASGCDSGSYRLKTYPSNPGTCPTNYLDYTLTSPQTISSHLWVCGAAKDLATPQNTGFSSPVEFKVDKIKPSTAVTDPADGSWQKDDFIATIDDSDAGYSGLVSGPSGCQYLIEDLNSGKTTGVTSRQCDPVNITVPVGVLTADICAEDRIAPIGQSTCKVSSRSFDNAGNNSGWKSRDFRIDYTSPNVGKISCANLPGEVCYPGSPCLAAEQGIEKSFCATLTDPVGKVTGCWLYVDGEFKKAGTVSPIPCQDGAACSVSVNYAFAVSGSHTMRFSCKDAAGNYGWGEPVTVNVTVNHPPQITDGPRYITSPCTSPTTQPGCNVLFRVSAIDEDGDALTYSWLFGDGTSSVSQNPSHHYDIANTYSAMVTVSDGRGGVVTAGISVPVENPTLSVNLLADPAFGTGSLSGVKLRAIVAGSMSGSINYYFDSNLANGDCTADGNYSDCDYQTLNQTVTDYLTPPIANYSVGTYTAKVLVERGTGTAPGTAEIKVIETVCTPGQTTTCTSSQGCSHTITCQTSGTWPTCPTDQCPRGLSMSCGSCGTQTCSDSCVWGACTGQGVCSPGPDSSNCPCPPDKCVGADYYVYPAYGDCATSCYCSSGTASGQPCQPIITPNDETHCATTLSVDLKLATDSTNWQDKLTGSAPILGVDFQATVSGTMTGTINYKIDCQNDGVWEEELNNTNINPYVIDNLCNFTQAKTYTARVKVERGTKSAEDAATIYAYSNPPTAQIGCDNSQCGLGSSCGPDIAYNRNCQFSYLNQSTDLDNDITKSVWSIFYENCQTGVPWADPYLVCSGLCNITLPSLPASQNYCVKLYVEDNTGSSDSATRTFYVRREAIAEFDCSLNPEAEEAWQSCDSFIVNEGVVVYFLDKSSASEGSGGIIHREWTFKDGNPSQNIDNETSLSSSFQKVDQNSGKVTLEIEDDVGRKDTNFHQVLPTVPLPEWKEVPPL